MNNSGSHNGKVNPLGIISARFAIAAALQKQAYATAFYAELAGGHVAACHFAEQVSARAAEEAAATQSVIDRRRGELGPRGRVGAAALPRLI